jgi:hypothetical protein
MVNENLNDTEDEASNETSNSARENLADTPSKEADKNPQPETQDDEKVTEPSEHGTEEKSESDVKPEVRSAQSPEPAKVAAAANEKHLNIKGFFRWYWSWKKWLLPLTLILILLILYLVPFTRYKILGLFIKEPFTVALTDSTTHTTISGATLEVDGQRATTNARGIAVLKVPVGHHSLSITKQYYKNTVTPIFVSTSKNTDYIQVQLVATGRQVPIKIVNLISGKGIQGAEIKVLDTEAKTDSSGNAVVVVPASSTTDNATITASGYNKASIKLDVTNLVVSGNTFHVTPAGKIYFLSKLTGTINVDETNLDGTDRQTVLAGTGNESDTGTVLLASRDWKYLALLAQRSATGSPELDLITTSNNQMSNIDEGSATFTPIGWDGDDFIYEVSRTDVPNYQPGQELLKSFNAATKKITVLDQTAGSGTLNDSTSQTIDNPYILSNEIVYTKDWSSSDPGNLASQQATLNAVQPDGSGKTVIKSFSLVSGTQSYSIDLTLSYPDVDTLYIDFYDGTKDNYYEYKNSQITADATLSDDDFYSQTYPTYLLSPSGDKTFWSESRDGANSLFVGDSQGNNQTQIASLSPYDSYGWYTDSYVLVSENSSELYIMPVTGGTPIKITDYHKPNVTFYGYGGGYGGR